MLGFDLAAETINQMIAITRAPTPTLVVIISASLILYYRLENAGSPIFIPGSINLRPSAKLRSVNFTTDHSQELDRRSFRPTGISKRQPGGLPF
jgi:hypothetical protein